MNTQTMILVALGIALLIVGAVFGVSSGVLDQAGDAVENLTENAESGDLSSDTTGTSFEFKREVERRGIKS